MTAHHRHAWILPVAVLSILAGCAPEGTYPAPVGHYLHSPESVAQLDRVVFVELYSRDGEEAFAETMTDSVARSLTEKQLFELGVLRSSEPIYELLPLQKRNAPTYEDMLEIRRRLNCDAVLFGWVERFEPYPHMEANISLRLLDLNRGRLVWGVDHVWDTGQNSVERRIRDFYYTTSPREREPAEWRMAAMSPLAFGRFVAFEIAQTLPGANDVEPMEERIRREKRQRTVREIGEKLEDL